MLSSFAAARAPPHPPLGPSRRISDERPRAIPRTSDTTTPTRDGCLLRVCCHPWRLLGGGVFQWVEPAGSSWSARRPRSRRRRRRCSSGCAEGGEDVVHPRHVRRPQEARAVRLRPVHLRGRPKPRHDGAGAAHLGRRRGGRHRARRAVLGSPRGWAHHPGENNARSNGSHHRDVASVVVRSIAAPPIACIGALDPSRSRSFSRQQAASRGHDDARGEPPSRRDDVDVTWMERR